jgi:Ca-activated chloride channel family protein
MNIYIALDRQLYGPGGAMRHLWVRLEAPRSPASETSRAPLDIELVLDRSGSMGGSKIEYTRRAASMAVTLLREADRCGLVAYDNEILRPAACRALDGGQRSRLQRGIERLHARGSTDLFGGWLTGAEELSRLGGERVRRVLIMTDGLANVGVTDRGEILHHVRELASRGVGTTAFGVGLDFDEVLVSGMAEAGNGHFYYIERPEQIPDFLSSELGELLRVAAKSVRLGVAVEGGAQIHNLNDVPLIGAMYHLGDLTEGSITDLCFVLNVPAGAQSEIDVRVMLTWLDPTSGEERTTASDTKLLSAPDAQVEEEAVEKKAMEQVVKARVARARSDALKLNDGGDFDSASRRLSQEADVLRELSVAYGPAAEEATALRQERMRVSAPMMASMKKQMMYDSYKARRSR